MSSVKIFKTKNSEYEIHERIECGGHNAIFKGMRVGDNLPIIVKSVRTKEINRWEIVDGKSVPAEVYFLTKVKDIDGCVSIIEYCEIDDAFIMIFTSHKDNVDLFDYLSEYQKKFGPLPLEECRNFLAQIVNVIIRCKNVDIVHNDIKQENIVINSKTKELCLIDFGAARHIQDENFTTFEGTRVYAPPEWYTQKSYGWLSATVWSLGILLVSFIEGDVPYEEPDEIIYHSLQFTNKYSQRFPLRPSLPIPKEGELFAEEFKQLQRDVELAGGLYNSTLTSQPPTVTSSKIHSNSESFDPVRGWYQLRYNYKTRIPIVSQFIQDIFPDKISTLYENKGVVSPCDVRKEIFKTAHEITTQDYLDMYAAARPWIDQGCSMNCFINSSTSNKTSQVANHLIQAHKRGLKNGVYYTHSIPAYDQLNWKKDSDECTSCAL